jgi:hydrogenase/urease accessory protein HupE
VKIASLAVLALLAVPVVTPALAHEVRPAYLELRESQSGELDVLWKTPMIGEMRLALAPVLSGATKELTPTATQLTGNAAVQTWRLRLLEPLRGRSLHVGGLTSTMTDVLVRIEFADGVFWVTRLTPQAPQVEIPEHQGRGSVAVTYLALGVEHILLGIDHLLFVLALLLVTRGMKRLALTITAFTIAHSITLALATLGFVQMPPPPVEAVIALSIVFVAAEILRARHGGEGLTARAPWIVAFTFGLLHGFGFAGALAEIGLPMGQIPLALFFFNVGVEAGQLVFVAAILAIIALARRARVELPRWAELAPPYAIGSVAMYWVIQRVATF